MSSTELSPTSLGRWFKRNLPFFIFLLIAFALRWSVTDQYVVPSGSMEPTIQIGDHIVVNKMAYDLRLPYTRLVLSRIGDPSRGDIVVFENPRDSVTMVKRLIGMPGDHLEIDSGFVTVNGKKMSGSEQGITALAQATEDVISYHEDIGGKDVTLQRMPFMVQNRHFELTVPPDEFFAMGDNRDNSADSRVWGFIPRDKLKGRAFGVLWSVRFVDWLPKVDFTRTAHGLN